MPASADHLSSARRLGRNRPAHHYRRNCDHARRLAPRRAQDDSGPERGKARRVGRRRRWRLGAGYGAEPGVRGSLGLWTVGAAGDQEPGVQGMVPLVALWHRVDAFPFTGQVGPTQEGEPGVQGRMAPTTDPQPRVLRRLAPGGL